MRRLPFPLCFTLTKPGSAQRFVARVKIPPPPPLPLPPLAQVFGSDVEVPTWPDWRSYLSRGPTSPQNQPSYSF